MDKDKREQLKVRWNELKVQYPWQDLRKEWDKYADWYEKKNGKELHCNIITVEWFAKSWLKNKPAPVMTIPSLKEYSDKQKHYYSGQTAQVLNLLEGENLLTEEIKMVLNKAIFQEGATVHNIQDWMMGTGRPVYPNSKILLELIKQKYTSK